MVAPNAKDSNTTFNNPEPVLCNYKIATTDEFNEDTLNLQWQFNHNPVWNKFSFTEREGWLRLHTCNVTDSLYYAKNTITQRILGPISTATLKMDITNMKDGDVAGFSVFQWPYRSIAVVKEATRKLLQIRVYDKPQEELTFNEDIIYLRAVVNAITEHFSFYYSFDNETFYSMGSDFATVFDLDHNFTGSRYAIFNYAEKETGGYVDIDWFRVDMKEGHYHTENAYEPVEAEYFTYNNKGEMAWGTERSDYKNQDVVYSSRRGYLGYHYIDFGDYAPESMTLSYSSTSLAQFKVNLNIRRDSSDGERSEERRVGKEC